MLTGFGLTPLSLEQSAKAKPTITFAHHKHLIYT